MIKSNKIFGLDISDNSIEVMLLNKTFSSIKVEGYGRKVLRGEIVKDGIIKNEEKLSQIIKQVLAEAQPKPIKATECILSLPESKAFTHIFYFPAHLDKDQIKQAVPYEAEKIIPFKTDEIYFDFKIINKDKKWQEVLYAATYPKVVESYVKVLEQAELKPVAFDLESISLFRALIGKEDYNNGILIIDIGARSTNLNIFYRQGLRASTIINIGGNRLTKAIAKEMNVGEEEAEKLKQKSGFDPKQHKGEVVLILQKELRRVIKEAQVIIDYSKNRQKNRITKVIMVGGSSLVPNITDYFSENLSIPVNLGNPFRNISVDKDFNTKRKAVLFANVIGLASRGLGKKPKTSDIDLLAIKTKKFEIIPEKEEKKVWHRIYISAAIFVLLILLLGAVVIMKQKEIGFFKTNIANQDQMNIEADIDIEELEKLREEEIITPGTIKEMNTSTDESSDELIVSIEEEAIATTTIEVLILDTPTGFLNVRTGPGTYNAKVTQVIPGEKYILVEQDSDWYKIKINEEEEGWVYSVYAELQE